MKNKELYSDAQLILLIQKGDEFAFRTLFNKYFQSLARFAFQITKEEGIAEEAVSDAFISIWDKRRLLQIQEGIKPYLFSAVKNKALNSTRNQPNFTSLNNNIEQSYMSLSVEELIISQESCKQLEGVLESLKEPFKTIFLLSREEKMSYKAIADLLNISVKTVEYRMGKALKSLKTHLENKELLSHYYQR